MQEAASYYNSLISIYAFPLRFLPQFKLMRNLILEQNYIGDVTLINVNINGRNLIELENIEQLIEAQQNCKHCAKENAAYKEQINEKLNNRSSSSQPSSIERTDDSSLDESSLDQNKLASQNEKNEQLNSQNHTNTSNHQPTHQNHSNNDLTSLASHQNRIIIEDRVKNLNVSNNDKKVNSTCNKKVTNINLTNINLTNKLAISIQDNVRYKEIMKQGGILNSLGPHVIDILTFVTNLRVKKCNGLLRTFNSSPFINQLSLIKRINVDDFCTFQLQMDKMNSSLNSVSSNFASAIRQSDKTNDKTRSNDVNTKTQTSLKSSVKFKELANNKPIAVVTLNDHLETLDKSYEIVIAGEFGYLRLKDGNLFGRQYEQNNNDGSTSLDSLEEEKAFYLIKNNLKLDNHCAKHQDQELTKLLINHKQIFRPFKTGLENLIGNMANAFDNESKKKDCFKKPLNNRDLNGKNDKTCNGRLKQMENLEEENQSSNEKSLNQTENLKVDNAKVKNDKKIHQDSTQTNKITSHNNVVANGDHKLIESDKKIKETTEQVEQSNQTTETSIPQQNSVNATKKELIEKPEVKQDENENSSAKLQKVKEAICSTASNFEDGKYVQSVIEAIRLSSFKCEWIRPGHQNPMVIQPKP